MEIAKNHYDDCPYGCNSSGKILDVNLKEMILCPHCSARKKELLKRGYVETESDQQVSIASVLGIESAFLSTKFVYDSVIPEGELLFIDEESVEWQKEVAEDLYNKLVVGEVPDSSYCFGLGIKCDIDKFAYPMLAKAYLNGISISKFVSCSEYSRYILRQDSILDNMFTSDFLMMLISEGCTQADLSAAKGLMQTRALKGKPTVFLSSWTIEACSGLLGFKDDSSLFLAKPVFVKYKKGSYAKEHSSYINRLLGVENRSLG